MNEWISRVCELKLNIIIKKSIFTVMIFYTPGVVMASLTSTRLLAGVVLAYGNHLPLFVSVRTNYEMPITCMLIFVSNITSNNTL